MTATLCRCLLHFNGLQQTNVRRRKLDEEKANQSFQSTWARYMGNTKRFKHHATKIKMPQFEARKLGVFEYAAAGVIDGGKIVYQKNFAVTGVIIAGDTFRVAWYSDNICLGHNKAIRIDQPLDARSISTM